MIPRCGFVQQPLDRFRTEVGRELPRQIRVRGPLHDRDGVGNQDLFRREVVPARGRRCELILAQRRERHIPAVLLPGPDIIRVGHRDIDLTHGNRTHDRGVSIVHTNTVGLELLQPILKPADAPMGRQQRHVDPGGAELGSCDPHASLVHGVDQITHRSWGGIDAVGCVNNHAPPQRRADPGPVLCSESTGPIFADRPLHRAGLKHPVTRQQDRPHRFARPPDIACRVVLLALQAGDQPRGLGRLGVAQHIDRDPGLFFELPDDHLGEGVIDTRVEGHTPAAVLIGVLKSRVRCLAATASDQGHTRDKKKSHASHDSWYRCGCRKLTQARRDQSLVLPDLASLPCGAGSVDSPLAFLDSFSSLPK